VIYLDTGALVSLFVSDAHSLRMLDWIEAKQPVVVVSTFGLVEFDAAITARQRTGRLDHAEAFGILQRCDRWVADQARAEDVDPADHRVAAIHVRRFELGLRAPDALHLATCARLGLPLLTLDHRQAAAAAALGLALVPAEAGA
jgi:predicted nucleic acid-binding protein